MRLYVNQPIGTVPRARQLRKAAPEPERRLLRGVREAFPALKWRHQAPVGPYFIDLLCISEALAIEVDGDTHAEAADYDATRTRFIEREGFHVLRFAVLAVILYALAKVGAMALLTAAIGILVARSLVLRRIRSSR